MTSVATTTTASASISSNSLEMPHYTRETVNVMDRPVEINAEQSQRMSLPLIPSVSNSQMWTDYTQRSSAEQMQMANNNPVTQSCTLTATLQSQSPSVSASETQRNQTHRGKFD